MVLNLNLATTTDVIQNYRERLISGVDLIFRGLEGSKVQRNDLLFVAVPCQQ